MSEVQEDFVPTDLGAVLGEEAVDAPVVEETKPELVEDTPEEVKPEPEATPEEAVEPETVKPEEDQAANFSELRALIKEVKAENAELKAGQEPVKVPDVFEDQEGFRNSILGETQNTIRNMSINMAQQYDKDFDAKRDAVLEAAASDKVLETHLFNLPPETLGNEILKRGADLLQAKAMKDPEQYKADMKAEILAELKAEADGTKEAEAEKAALKTKLPDDLSSEANAGTRAKKEVFEPTSLDAILPD